MADWKKIEKQIEKVIADANVVINSNKTNITDVIEDLISGYGQGGSGGGTTENIPTIKGVKF